MGFQFAMGCSYDRADRWLDPPPAPPETCQVGAKRCFLGVERCVEGPAGPAWQTEDDCPSRGQVCVPERFECRPCVPGKTSCSGAEVVRCDDAGEGVTTVQHCSGAGVACRDGSCTNLCTLAAIERSNVGCEYWAVDLDNAHIDETLNAAAQQFAIVVSNPQSDISAHVRIEQDDTQPGQAGAPKTVAEVTVPPLGLRIFRLGPREVDGSPPGEFNTGTHTALTRAAYRLDSDTPIIAYQFNPLQNVNVFSNDASLLKPVEALAGGAGINSPSYAVLGWPQTIATTDDPKTNFDSDLRAFLTLVGTRPNTTVRLRSTTRFLGNAWRKSGTLSQAPAVPIPEGAPGQELEVVLQPFDVLNLETDGFNADFSGSLISADQPVVVYSGSEASDAPHFESLPERRCCADHLEEQLDPIRTTGTRFVATVSANRSEAVIRAGSQLGAVKQPEYFRLIATTNRGARVRTSLPDESATLELAGLGDWTEITATDHFLLESDAPIMLSSVSPSQEAAGVVRGTPGGDPSLLIVPPIEQFRSSYVFLTPDQYGFDFVRIIAPPGARISLDNRWVSELSNCTSVTLSSLGTLPSYQVYTCQLGFPVINTLTTPLTVEPGEQHDGVHTIMADYPVGVLVDGFDAFVSYAYAAGTDLRSITLE